MAKSSYYWDQFKDENLRKGYHESELGSLPGAADAVQKDKAANWESLVNAPAEKWKNHSEGEQIQYFRSHAEMITAMKNPLYTASANYRAAVDQMGRNTPIEFLYANSDEPGPDLLADAARADALRATYKQLVAGCASDPVKRLQLVDFLSNPDPDVQNLINEGTRSIDQGQSHNGEQVRHVGSNLGHAMSNPGESSTPVQRDEQKAAKVQGWDSLLVEARNAGIDVGPEGGR